jgi:hypothetical protein
MLQGKGTIQNLSPKRKEVKSIFLNFSDVLLEVIEIRSNSHTDSTARSFSSKIFL